MPLMVTAELSFYGEDPDALGGRRQLRLPYLNKQGSWRRLGN
jgi:hypothetical protein